MERHHLQEWVLAYPTILGEEVLIITFEFDRWVTGAGHSTMERLDVLGLDRAGRLVVAELKRDRAPDGVVTQGLNYAAMVSRFTLDLLVEAYGHRQDGDDDPQGWLAELQEWAPGVSDETLGPPRLVLVAEDFGPVLTNTAMFLIEQGLDLRLVRVQLYEMGQQLALTTSQVLPVPDAEEFMVRPRSSAPTQRSAKDAATRRARIVDRIIEAEAIADGAELSLAVPTNVGQDREAIREWLAADTARSKVTWRADPKTPVEWAIDGERWTTTRLVRQIIEAATGEPPQAQVWGPNWIVDHDGLRLDQIANALPSSGGFDWSALHALLGALPLGSWTTYGELAQVVGTAAQPLGQHLANCTVFPTPGACLGLMVDLDRTSPGVTRTTAGPRQMRCARKVSISMLVPRTLPSDFLATASPSSPCRVDPPTGPWLATAQLLAHIYGGIVSSQSPLRCAHKRAKPGQGARGSVCGAAPAGFVAFAASLAGGM